MQTPGPTLQDADKGVQVMPIQGADVVQPQLFKQGRPCARDHPTRILIDLGGRLLRERAHARVDNQTSRTMAKSLRKLQVHEQMSHANNTAVLQCSAVTFSSAVPTRTTRARALSTGSDYGLASRECKQAPLTLLLIREVKAYSVCIQNYSRGRRYWLRDVHHTIMHFSDMKEKAGEGDV